MAKIWPLLQNEDSTPSWIDRVLPNNFRQAWPLSLQAASLRSIANHSDTP